MSCLEMRVLWVNLPNFFETKTVVLITCRIFIEIEARFQMLCERATCSFREYCLLCHNLHTWHVVVFLAAIFGDAESTCDNAFDDAITVLNH